ncbi:MAG: ABC transporter substrate-binding protein [Chloroflexi bacterium]|nr:ABC transporter substrate-binding protein [Chloroflexota bacterium]
MKRNLLYVLVLVTLLLSACGGGTAPTATSATEAPASGISDATLKIGWIGKPDTLNPAYAFLTESYTIFDLIYSTLVTESADGTYVGMLAKDWSVSEDGLTWTYHLKDGIQWHNGEPFTAGQLAWAINAIMKDPDGWAASANYTGGFKEVTAPDDKTLVIVTEYPIANMDYRTSFLYAVYPPDFETFTTSEDLQNFTNFNAIGTGPFKLNTFDKDTGVLLLGANPAYFDGAPKIGGVIFQTFDNTDAMIQALKVGDIDLVNEVPASAFETVKGFENVTASAIDGRYFNELIINSVDPNNDPAPTGNPALADPAVRLAIAHSINKQDIVEVVAQGLATPGDTIVPPTLGGGFWHSPNIKEIPFDTAEAGRVLEDAGYVLGSDGVRAKGDLRLEFRLQFPSDSAVYPRIADLMAGWFAQAGMKATPEAVDPDALVAATTPAGDYDLVLWGWGPDPDPDFILSVMTTDQFVDGGWSDSGYHNPEYDQLYLDQQQIVDKAERQKVVWKMQEMVFNDRPYIVMYYEKMLQAYRSDRFTGFIESPLGIESAQSLLSVTAVK